MKWFSFKHRLVRKVGASEEHQASLPIQHGDKFDESTGQVYTDWYVPIMDSNDQNWARRGHSVREYHEEKHMAYDSAQDIHNSVIYASKGARSLQDIAISSVSSNISNIPLDVLRSLPILLVDRLLEEVVRSSNMSLELWKKFSILLRSRDETTLRTMRYRELIKSPHSPLKVYTTPLISISYDFITYLSITTTFQVPDLVKLSEIPNLGVLEIVKASEAVQLTIGDRLVRAWSIAASTEGAFRVLRILRLWDHKDVTTRSLEYINAFPVLGIYDVRGCGFSGSSPVHARRLGWIVSVDRNILYDLAGACVERTIRLRTKYGLDPQLVRKATAEQLWDGAKVHKIRREDVAAFLIQEDISRLDTPKQHASGADYRFMESDLQARPSPHRVAVTTRSHLDVEDMFYGLSKERTWEFHLYSAYTRLGELRADYDISGPGINIGDQAVLGTELVNSIPMVSLRLGTHPPELLLESRNMGTHNPRPAYSSIVSRPDFDTKYLCFVRIEIPPVLGKDKKKSAAAADRAPKRKSVSRVVEGKKMKLGDVLGTYL
ncbi:hypothetical protein N431DRAFT_413850 [Stipitochalara longipes BDJ]|nr:hypothetical protein N431DRAFT_413850 [Stipitochalara longipes BDJ]